MRVTPGLVFLVLLATGSTASAQSFVLQGSAGLSVRIRRLDVVDDEVVD